MSYFSISTASYSSYTDDPPLPRHGSLPIIPVSAFDGYVSPSGGLISYVSYEGQAESVTGGGTAPAPAKPAAPAAAVKVEAARHIDKALAGAYRTTANLNLRAGAGTGDDKTVLVVVPKGGTVRNYGYYNTVDGKKWLYVQYSAGGKTYTGYCSMAYLKK